jgi:hypothetical protein
MRYVMAWLVGVPFSVIVLWYIVGHIWRAAKRGATAAGPLFP